MDLRVDVRFRAFDKRLDEGARNESHLPALES